MWHEFRVVLHNREHTLVSLLAQSWSTEEREYVENAVKVLSGLEDGVANMPLE